MQEPHSEGVAHHAGPESCAGGGNAAGEALTGENAGQVFSSEITSIGVRTPNIDGEGHTRSRVACRMIRSAPHHEILDHAESTRHRGELAPATHSSSARNPLCGDQISLSLRIDDERIAEIRFNARGCVISRAAASMLCEAVEGKPLEEVRGMTEGDVLGMIGFPLSPVRRVCALLAFRCLQDAVRESG